MSKREQFTLLLDNQSNDETMAALDALKLAFEWCLESMTPETLTSGSRAQALKSVLKLNDTLQAGEQLIDTIFAPDVVSRAKLGQTVQDALHAKQHDIVSLRKELNAVKKDVETLTEKEEQAQKMADEHTTLQHRCRELETNIERLSHFSEEDVAQLRRQVEILEQHLPPQGKDVEQYEKQLEQTGEEFLLLTDTILSHLSKQAKNTLRRVKTREEKLRATAQKIQKAMERYQEIDEQLTERKNILKLYLSADREVVRVLPNARQLEDVLDEVERLLKGADQALKEAMAANEKARKLSELGYT